MTESSDVPTQQEITQSITGADALQEAVERRRMIVRALKDGIMRENVHHGRIPGCGEKMVLLLPGAQTISVLMRLRPEYEVKPIERPGGHTEYIVYTRLVHYPTGAWVGTGIGSAATDEARYVTRWAPTGQPIPKDYRDRRAEYAKQGFSARKIDGEWAWCRKVEETTADARNTVLKVAKKRSFVDAVIQAAAAADLYTQDVEDGVVDEPQEPPHPQPQQKQSRAPQTEKSVASEMFRRKEDEEGKK